MPNRQPIAFLARHGEDTLTGKGIHVSWLDVPLTAKGKEQGQEVVDFLDDYDIQLVHSSPLLRCVTLAEMLGKPFQQQRALLPWNRGVLTGSLEEDSKDLLKLLLTNPTIQVPYGESRRQCEDRLSDFFGPSLRIAEDKMTVFYTHHSVIDVLNSLVLGKRNDEPVNLVKPGGVVAVYLKSDGDYELEPVLNADEKTMVGVS